jgi:altronate dehydratase
MHQMETTKHNRIVVAHQQDNVGIALRALEKDTLVETPGGQIRVTELIECGHKISLREITSGESVLKYGESIGRATQTIPPGALVHVHNLAADFDGSSYEHATRTPATQFVPAEESGTFLGYARENGDVGTRNYVAVIATSNCSSHVVEEIGERFKNIRNEDVGIDGVVAIPHQEGCGHSQGEDTWQLERTIAGMIYHPNVGAVLMVSLGCEVNQLSLYTGTTQLDQQGFRKGKRIVGLEMQTTGGTTRTVEAGVEEVRKLMAHCQEMSRTPQPMSRIVMGTNCGGSDAFSGISANPALGYASDLLVRSGGTSVLAEIPECVGAAHLLTRRAVDERVGKKVVDTVDWYREYLRRFGAKWDDNPSPGNKAGGISNIAEKSLGAVAKGGTTALTAVYRYAERVNKPGLVLMNTPGYDPVSLTGIAAGGANVIVFTTGRGSGIGFPLVPVIKVSSNSRIAEVMRDNIDIDAGTILEGRETVQDVGAKIFDAVRRVSSGERTKSEFLGHREFVPWRIGPVL